MLFTHFGVTTGITQGFRVIPEVTPKWVNNTNVHSKFTLISLFSKIHSLKSERIHSFLFREYSECSGTTGCRFVLSDCLATSPGLLPTLCEKWSGFFYVHWEFLSYTRDRRLKDSSERLCNEDKATCPRALLPGRGSNRGPPVWKSEALTAQPRQLQVRKKMN